MHRNRINGALPELKAKQLNRFDDKPLNTLNVMHNHLDGEAHDVQKVKKDRAAKQLTRVQNMFKGMADYANKQDKRT